MNKLKPLFLVVLLAIGITNLFAQNDCAGFKTFTQGGWGASCNGGNPGCYLKDNFAGAFPSGLTIGCNNQLTLTSYEAVNDFLPSGSSASALPAGNIVDPGQDYRNVLAGQLVALTLNVKFDLYDPNFASNTDQLADLVIAQGPFTGWTVAAFLQVANNVIGECSSAYSYADVNSTADNINRNFDNGTVNNGYLICRKLEVSLNITAEVLCNGANTGAISSALTGGTAPYTYLWSNSATTADLTSITAGTYTLTVTDAYGKTASASVTLTEPAALVVSTSGSDISCFGGSNGSATVTVGGGVAPYTILWTNGGTTETITDLSAGEYAVTVTDANQCVSAASVVLTQPELLLTVTSATNVSCFGGNNGTASVSATGGIEPYTYAWSNGETTADLIGLTAGVYTVVVTDNNACIAIGDTLVITQPDALSAITSATDVLCFGGQDGAAVVTVSGGVSPYTILWNNGNTEANLSGLTAGSYSVSVTDANGCEIEGVINVNQPELLAAGAIVHHISCYGAQDGSVSLTITGGTAPYNVLWNNGSSQLSLAALTAGTYAPVITDAHQCVTSLSVTIEEPLPLSLAVAKTDVTCYGGQGTATVTVTGGTAPYSYNWVGQDFNDATVSLPVGTYTVIVTDANNCSSSSTVSLVLLTCNGFTTVTQGGWGAKCNGNNWGCYLNANFASSFPAGLTVGACGRYIKFTTAAAVNAFLPCSGTPKALNAGTLGNPASTTVKNTLAGQVVTLTLNVAFDLNNPNFGASNTALQNLIITSGMFQGWSVAQVLAEANNVLGGCSNYAASDLTAIIDAINRNYDNGTVNLGLLACPCEIEGRQATTTFTAPTASEGIAVVSAYPNPAADISTIEFSVNYTAYTTIEIYNSTTGQLVAQVYSGTVNAGDLYSIPFSTEKLNNGVYIVKMLTDKNIQSSQLMIMK